MLPRGERIALRTRAMALVLAGMADEDVVEEAGGDAATAGPCPVSTSH